MSAGKCQLCGNEYKNIGNHKCKAKKQEDTQKDMEVTPTPNIIDTDYIESAMTPEALTYDMGVSEEAPRKDAGTHTESAKEEPKLSLVLQTPWYKKIFARKLTSEKKKVSITEMLDNLPKWSIKEKKPWSKPKNKNATWIQIVAFSRTRAPKAVWAEYDGVSISIDDMFFPAPHEIRGDIFPYDMDKGIPLLDNSDQFNDMSYWNKLVERVKNMYFTLGLVSGAGDFTKNIGLILMMVGVCILAVVINIIITYGLTKDFAIASANIGNTTAAVQNYIATHP